jgi:hypothetical protein
MMMMIKRGDVPRAVTVSTGVGEKFMALKDLRQFPLVIQVKVGFGLR